MFSQGLIRDLINIKSLRTFLLTRDIKKYINSNTALIFRNAFLCRKILSKSLLSPLLSFCCILSTYFGEGNGNPIQYFCLENPMDGGAWWAAVHGVKKSRTRLSDFTFTFHSYALEKEMATHSSVLSLRIPGTGEPGGLLSMGSHRVGHD